MSRLKQGLLPRIRCYFDDNHLYSLDHDFLFCNEMNTHCDTTTIIPHKRTALGRKKNQHYHRCKNL